MMIGKVGQGGSSTSPPSCEAWLICPLTEPADQIMIRITVCPPFTIGSFGRTRRRTPWAILDLALVGWIPS